MIMLTSDEVEKLCIQELVGKPSGITGRDADQFLASFRRDLQTAKKNGWIVELPFEIPDFDESEANFSESKWHYFTKKTDEPPGYNVFRQQGDKVQIFDWDEWKYKDVE